MLTYAWNTPETFEGFVQRLRNADPERQHYQQRNRACQHHGDQRGAAR